MPTACKYCQSTSFKGIDQHYPDYPDCGEKAKNDTERSKHLKSIYKSKSSFQPDQIQSLEVNTENTLLNYIKNTPTQTITNNLNNQNQNQNQNADSQGITDDR